jgi:hypothetical protein
MILRDDAAGSGVGLRCGRGGLHLGFLLATAGGEKKTGEDDQRGLVHVQPSL